MHSQRGVLRPVHMSFRLSNCPNEKYETLACLAAPLPPCCLIAEAFDHHLSRAPVGSCAARAHSAFGLADVTFCTLG